MHIGATGLAASLAVLLAGNAMAAPAPQPTATLAKPDTSTPALLQAGLTAFQRGDHNSARQTFRQLAQRDVAAAETLLGTMAAKGQGSARDDAVAAAWFMRAARRGYAPAQLALADAFARGRGVKQDRTRAIALARAAALQNQPGAAQLVARHAPTQLAMVADTTR
jgi:TPR repeat protein